MVRLFDKPIAGDRRQVDQLALTTGPDQLRYLTLPDSCGGGVCQ